jgi:hypothetical protein
VGAEAPVEGVGVDAPAEGVGADEGGSESLLSFRMARVAPSICEEAVTKKLTRRSDRPMRAQKSAWQKFWEISALVYILYQVAIKFFSKISALVYILYEVAIKRTFEICMHVSVHIHMLKSPLYIYTYTI